MGNKNGYNLLLRIGNMLARHGSTKLLEKLETTYRNEDDTVPVDVKNYVKNICSQFARNAMKG